VLFRVLLLFDCLTARGIYKSAKAQIFPHYESAKKLLRKRNSDRYRDPQQRFTKPQTGQELGYFEVVGVVFRTVAVAFG